MELSFDGTEAIIKQAFIPTENGGKIPLELKAIKDDAGEIYYSAEVDGVQWFEADNVTHGVILFSMMQKHLLEYMNYISTDKE